MSQENLSPGNCVAATVFPKEIKSLPINVATVYRKEIMSPGNTVERDCLRRRAKFVVKEGVFYYRDKESGDFQVI